MNLNQYIAENFVKVPGIGYVAKDFLKTTRPGLSPVFLHNIRPDVRANRFKVDGQENIIDLTPQESFEILRRLGSRRLTLAEFWKTLNWAEHNSPELYESLTNTDISEVLDGTFIPQTVSDHRVEAELRNKAGYNIYPHGLKIKNGEKHTLVLPLTERDQILGQLTRFKRGDVSPLTGFPELSSEDGEYIIRIGLKTNQEYAIIWQNTITREDGLTTEIKYIDASHTPNEKLSLDRDLVERVCVREVI